MHAPANKKECSQKQKKLYALRLVQTGDFMFISWVVVTFLRQESPPA